MRAETDSRFFWPMLSCVVLAIAACSESNPSSADAAAGDSAMGDGRIPDGASDSTAPDSRPDANRSVAFELKVLRQAGYPARLYVPVMHKDAPGLLLHDTGSPYTFVALPPSAPPGSATLIIGSETWSVSAQPYDLQESHEGLSVIGLLGNETLFHSGKWENDLIGGKLIRHRTTDTIAGFSTAWSKLAFDTTNNLNREYIFARITIDGHSLRMVLDTGGPHTLWLGQPGRPGDVAVPTQDGWGNPVTLYQGNSQIELAGEAPVSLPVLRTMSYPAIEAGNQQLGGQIDGIIGLSALGDRRFVIDGEQKIIWLEPRSP